MQSTGVRLGVLTAVVAAAVVLFIILNGGNDDDGGAPATGQGPQLIAVKDGNPVGGVKSLTYDKGDLVNLEVRLNVPEEEIHVHGYEIDKPAQTSPVRLSFPAELDGVFEVEVHRTDGGEAEIAELKVNP